MSEIIIEKPHIISANTSTEALEETRLNLVQISKYKNSINKLASFVAFVLVCIVGFTFFQGKIVISDTFNLFILICSILYILVPLHVIYALTNMWFRKYHNTYSKEFKSTVIKNFLLSYEGKLNYDLNGFIEPNYFYKSQLFLKRYSKYKGEDLITFNTFGDLKLCELDVEYRRKDSSYNMFKGVFGYATFPFEFEGVTVLEPKNAASMYFVGSRTSVYLESPRFMETWNVQSTSQIGARLALNTDIMDNLLELKKQLGDRYISVSFVGNQVFFAIDQSNFLNPDYNLSINDQKTVKDFQLEIQTIQNIVETFKLNQSKNQNLMTNIQKLSVLKSQHSIPSLMNAQLTPMSPKSEKRIITIIMIIWLLFVFFAIYSVITGK
jgi:Protein of unknown function (DUF3137)